ncbi:LysR family transcriptional regulator [Baekduia alba]|uniref:LysR family transcriptional regulator n=1 Tax=Baekduia alba TaxID=2997333 RepID=UPI002340C660|nr:LysR family transcriptional regulator [Baekduia alba]
MDLLTHLRCFVAVAEERHFGRAAARLHVTQPALSRTIARLERTLGARLFDRTSRTVRLSGVGELLFPDAERLVDGADGFVALAAQAARGEIGTIRAGVPLGLPAETMATLTRSFRERHPAVGLDLREQRPGTQLAAGLDVALLVPDDEHSAGLRRGPVALQELGVIASAAGAFASHAELHLADLAGRALALLPMDQSAWEPQLLAACRAGGFEPTTVHRPQQLEFALGLVLADDAVALGAAESAGAGLTWIPIVGTPARRRLQPVWQDAGDDMGRGRAFAEIAVDALCAGGAWRREEQLPEQRGPALRPGSFA